MCHFDAIQLGFDLMMRCLVKLFVDRTEKKLKNLSFSVINASNFSIFGFLFAINFIRK
jgi:hypothetical protein